jgi:hypothetical protein
MTTEVEIGERELIVLTLIERADIAEECCDAECECCPECGPDCC